MTKCFQYERRDGIFYNCALDWLHAGAHEFSRVGHIEIGWDQLDAKTVRKITADINSWDTDSQYSEERVKQALWKFIADETDELMDQLWDKFVSARRRDEFLGKPDLPGLTEGAPVPEAA